VLPGWGTLRRVLGPSSRAFGPTKFAEKSDMIRLLRSIHANMSRPAWAETVV